MFSPLGEDESQGTFAGQKSKLRLVMLNIFPFPKYNLDQIIPELLNLSFVSKRSISHR